jgi:hypothetical protein
MASKPKAFNKSFFGTRAAYEMLVCLVVVMLGGTRVLDYSSYEGADRLVRAALLDAGPTLAIAQNGELCTVTLTQGHKVALALTKHALYGSTRHNDCGNAHTTPFVVVGAFPDEIDTSEIAQQLMPLEYKVQEPLASHQEFTLFSSPVQGVVTWQVEVPKPPPRPAKA